MTTESHTDRKLLIRPESLRFLGPTETAENTVPVEIINEFSLGSRMQYHVQVAQGCTLIVECLREHRIKENRAILGWEICDSQVLEA